MSRRTYRTLGIIVAALLVISGMFFGGLFLISATTSTGSIENQSPVPLAGQYNPPEKGPISSVLNLEGSWTHTTDKGGVFETTITDKTIKIVMKAPTGTSMVYWYGSFGPYQYNGVEVTSNVIEEGTAVLSQSKSKRFVVGPDTLSFSFTAMGITKTVELRRA
jgi:hypothetical protein